MATDYAFGFVNLAHLFSEKLDNVGINVIWDAVVLTAAEHSRQATELMSSFVTPTTEYTERFKLPASYTLQPLDEWGNPLPVAPKGYYDVAYPIRGAGIAWGDNRVSRAMMTVEDANRISIEAMRADADWLRRHILASVFDNVAWTYEDPDYGSLSIKPLANGDGDTYPKAGGVVATDTHYLAQAAAIADLSNPFPTIYSELMEHPTNVGPVIAYVPTAQVATITALSDFHEVVDPDLTVGANATTLTGALPSRAFGDEVLGKVDKVWIVEWKHLPDEYIIAHAAGNPILKMRQYPVASLQGLFPEMFSSNGNVMETRLIRYAGFGTANRIGALVQRIGNAAYAIPSGYDQPIAV